MSMNNYCIANANLKRPRCKRGRGGGPMGHFNIFYKFTEKPIVVLAFWDNRDDSEKLEKLIVNQ